MWCMVSVMVALLLPACGAVYRPGQPGAKWSDTEAKIVKAKLLLAWKKGVKIAQDFIGPESSDYDYLYDPQNHTRVFPWEDVKTNPKLNQVKRFTKEMPEKFAFTARKALRLTFHDCIPYADGSGGCDGCLNLETNLKGNHGLQVSAAVLEKIYREKDFMKKGKDGRLPESLYDSGKSRGDLWAFAAIVAMDYFQKETEEQCRENWTEMMCDDVDLCFSPFPEAGRTMFRTGRVDCHGPQKDPKKKLSEKQEYVTFKLESHPNEDGNGKETTDYYKKHFGFSKRDSLAIMGAHTVGDFNTVFSRNTYAWTNTFQRNLFNNKYYKLLAAQPQKVWKECTGDIKGKAATGSYEVLSNVLLAVWRKSWTGHLFWSLNWKRCPNCVSGSYGHRFDADLWSDAGKESRKAGETGIEYCCRDTGEGMCNPDPTCTREVFHQVSYSPACQP